VAKNVPSMQIPTLAVTVAAVFLGACSFPASVASRLHPYQIDIRQGNYVDQAMVSQLRKGMTREQVRFVLGTPLLTDPFHADRWDYVYSYTPGGGEEQRRALALFFVDDKLDGGEGDVKAGDAAAAAADAAPQTRVIDLGAKPAAPAK
jgi:outer membrane protein assembly factor BamE